MQSWTTVSIITKTIPKTAIKTKIMMSRLAVSPVPANPVTTGVFQQPSNLKTK